MASIAGSAGARRLEVTGKGNKSPATPLSKRSSPPTGPAGPAGPPASPTTTSTSASSPSGSGAAKPSWYSRAGHRHLRPPPGRQRARVFPHAPGYVGYNRYVDLVGQRAVSHHFVADKSGTRESTTPFRYVWPSELDLMAKLAGMVLRDRWAGWDRTVFTGESTSHVSVFQKIDQHYPSQFGTSPMSLCRREPILLEVLKPLARSGDSSSDGSSPKSHLDGGTGRTHHR